MKKLLLAFMVLGFFAVFTSESYGQTTPRSDVRQKLQNKRLKHGVKNKSLTKKETARLAKQRHQDNKFERKIKSDGKVTLKERARLQHQQNQTSRKIYRKKHNKRDRN